ncbi:MAG: KpsF/GutQ family sugar-phosphate isomerase, partial [Parvularculaceae bacterium]
IVTGMGKSGHIARKIAATLASTGQPAMYVHPGEASHGDLGMIGQGDLVLALSNSGETPELGDIIAYCGRFHIPLLAITSGATSSLAKGADHLLLLPAAKEACGETRAPTTSTTMSLALGDALAVALLRDKGFSASDFRNYHPGGKLGAAFKQVRHMMHDHKELPLVDAETKMDEAVRVMGQCGFGCVGLVDGSGQLIGIVTDGDLRRHFDDSLPQRLARDIMTSDPLTVQPDTMAAEALAILSEKRITALFVVENGKPIGLLHVHDCLDIGVI